MLWNHFDFNKQQLGWFWTLSYKRFCCTRVLLYPFRYLQKQSEWMSKNSPQFQSNRMLWKTWTQTHGAQNWLRYCWCCSLCYHGKYSIEALKLLIILWLKKSHSIVSLWNRWPLLKVLNTTKLMLNDKRGQSHSFICNQFGINQNL